MLILRLMAGLLTIPPEVAFFDNFSSSILNKNYRIIPSINNKHPLQDEGVSIGDVITSVNGLDATWRNLTNALKMTLPGGDINLTILSKGKFKEVTVQTIIIN